jgi:hypothetical protein
MQRVVLIYCGSATLVRTAKFVGTGEHGAVRS